MTCNAVCADCRHLVEVEEPKTRFGRGHEVGSLQEFMKKAGEPTVEGHWCGKQTLPSVRHPVTGTRLFLYETEKLDRMGEPVWGEIESIYVPSPFMPCLMLNHDGSCEHFEPRESVDLGVVTDGRPGPDAVTADGMVIEHKTAGRPSGFCEIGETRCKNPPPMYEGDTRSKGKRTRWTCPKCGARACKHCRSTEFKVCCFCVGDSR